MSAPRLVQLRLLQKVGKSWIIMAELMDIKGSVTEGAILLSKRLIHLLIYRCIGLEMIYSSLTYLVVIYDILGQQLHTALSPHLGELLIEILEYDGGPLILTIDDLRVAKLYHP